MIKSLTETEISRTAFKYMEKDEFHDVYFDLWAKIFGKQHPDRSIDKNNICPYCKFNRTTSVVDDVYLEPFKKFFENFKGVEKFKVKHCSACNAIFSIFWTDKDEHSCT